MPLDTTSPFEVKFKSFPFPYKDFATFDTIERFLTFPKDVQAVLAYVTSLGPNGARVLQSDAAGNVQTKRAVGGTGNTGQLAVTTSAQSLIAANPNRLSVAVTNFGTTTIYIGTGSGVTTANGYPIAAGSSVEFFLSNQLWVIGGAAGSVGYFEEAV